MFSAGPATLAAVLCMTGFLAPKAAGHGAVTFPPPRNAIDWQNVTAQSQATYAAQLNAAQFCAIL